MNAEPRNVPVIAKKDIDKTVAASSVSPNLPAKRRLMVNSALCRKYERIVGHDKFNICLISCRVWVDNILWNGFLIIGALPFGDISLWKHYLCEDVEYSLITVHVVPSSLHRLKIYVIFECLLN